LYPLWYGEARPHFRRAQELDPGFGMAYWGEAMTYDNALKIRVYPGSEEAGTGVVARMDELDAAGSLRWTPLERGYADAVRQRFQEGLPEQDRRIAYYTAMSNLSEQYPEDHNVTAFFALSVMALPSFNKNDPAHIFEVAALLEQVYEGNPEHPGAVLYLAHLYEHPTFALMGLRQARKLSEIAPSAPHALLVACYIYGHTGMWEECAKMGEAAYEVDKRYQLLAERPVHTRVFRTLLWAIKCRLNSGQYEAARLILGEVDTVEAEIRRQGEAWGEFPRWAEEIRAAYRESVSE